MNLRLIIVYFYAALLLGAYPAWAQMGTTVDFAADRFSSELTSLKQSADRLAVGNEQLVAKNNALRISLSQYQGRLQKLLDESNALTRETLKLQDINSSRANKIADLEKNIFQLDTQMEHVGDDMKRDLAVLDRAKQDDERLTHQMATLGGSVIIPVAEPAKDMTKEKLRMLKMIDESKHRQEIISQQLMDSKRNKVVSVVTIEGPRDKEDLVKRIYRLQEEIDQLGKMHSNPLPQPQMWDEKELRQLDSQVSVLQKNHDELEELVSRMQEKAQKGALTKDELKEQRRLQASFDDVIKENRQLKQNLNDLRLQMVELDKRKSYLESLMGK